MDYELALIIRDIEQNFQYVISYAKTWRAKQKVFEIRFGTYEASYDNLKVIYAPKWVLVVNDKTHVHLIV